MKKENLKTFTAAEEKLIERIAQKRSKVQAKYPLLFILLVTFGAVSTLQGFQRLIDRIALFNNNPWILLLAGLGTLLATGTLYKKLN